MPGSACENPSRGLSRLPRAVPAETTPIESFVRRRTLEAHGGHGAAEHLVGAVGGVLLARGESFVERAGVGQQPLVALAQRSDVLLDDLGQQRLDVAVSDAALAVARIDLFKGGGAGEAPEQRDKRAGAGAARPACGRRGPSGGPAAWSP